MKGRTNRCTRGGGGGRSYFVCEARDDGWEEHWNGHSASGWTRIQARNQALRECQRYHGACHIVSCYVQR